MLFDSHGYPVTAPDPVARDPITGYAPAEAPLLTEEFRRDAADLVDAIRSGRLDSADALLSGAHLDAFVNALTGLGTVEYDKTLGGYGGGPGVRVNIRSFYENEARYRGLDIGRGLVERIPDETTRRGWDLEVQPEDDEIEVAADPIAHADAARAQPRRAAAGWRLAARSGRLDARQRFVARERGRRWDDVASGLLPVEAAPPPPPGPLPKINDDGVVLVEAMEKWAKELGIRDAVNQALRYERAYGGGAIFIGVDDGGMKLTDPLDVKRINAITHLTVMRGGFDGEVVMYRPYNDWKKANYGKPEIYTVRNMSVQVGRPPAPGEGAIVQTMPSGPGGSTIGWVHESRFLIFDGEPTSREAKQQLLGWGDSVFTRANDALSQYEQIWNAVAIIMQEFSIATLAIEGFAKALTEKGVAARDQFLQVARLQAITQSVARMRYIDSKEKFDRTTASVAGVGEILSAAATRVAATVETPVSVLFGKLAGGLGAAEDPTLRSFYDRIAGEQENRVLPPLDRFYRLGWLSKNGPTKGVEPKRWGIYFRSLWQLTELEEAELRSKTALADVAEVNAGIVTPEEVAATRYGGTEYNTGPIVLDTEGRSAQASQQRESAARAAERAQAVPAVESAPGSAPASPALPATGAAAVAPIPPMTAMPSNPITGDPSAVPSVVGPTT